MANKSNVQFVRKVRTKKPKTTTRAKSKSKKLTKAELKNKSLSYQIKYELQQQGINAKVRKCLYGHSTICDVYVDEKDREKATEIAYKFRKVEEDDRTGEALIGANTYVYVRDKDELNIN